MIEVSDRASHAFDNTAKASYRSRHLDVLREQAPELWDDQGRPRLRGAWLELMGATGWKTLHLLVDEGALAPSAFVGVDLDEARIADYRARYPDARWLAGDVLDHVQRPALADVSVVHFDGYEAAGGRRLEHVGEQLSTLLRRAIDRFGAAVLLLNSDLDANRRLGRPAAHALRQHATTLAAVLQGAVGARREFGAKGLLAEGAEQAVTDPAFVGLVGAFEVYRGKGGGHRMACLRAVLR